MAAPPMEIDADEDIFEVHDFTVVTDLEAFILGLEALIHDWLCAERANVAAAAAGDPAPRTRRVGSKPIVFKKHSFELAYYCDGARARTDSRRGEPATKDTEDPQLSHLPPAAAQLMSGQRDFCESSLLERQFGVSEYLLLTPSTAAAVKDEDALNIVLSALNVATLNADCDVPVFVRMAEPERQLYAGVCQNRNVAVSFEGAQLMFPLKPHTYLSGVLDIFKEKVNTPLNLEQRIQMSVQLEYLLRKGSPTPSEVGRLDDPEPSAAAPCDHHLACGSDIDPLKELRLTAAWLNVGENALAETADYSDLDPLSAPRWFASADFHGDSKLLLSDLLSELLDHREGDCASCRLSSLASPSAEGAGAAVKALGPLTHGHTSKELAFVPSQRQSTAAARDFSPCLEHMLSAGGQPSDVPDSLKAAKAAPPHSLTRRMATCLAKELLRSQGDAADLWLRVVQMLRDHWDSNEPLADFAADGEQPDLSQCLLHQKLQMLSYCIGVKRRRHSALDKQAVDGEEFFDAEEDFCSSAGDLETPTGRGRSHMLEGQCLHEYPERPIAVPLTQDPGPMTEDMIDEYASYLTSLDGGGDRTRAQLDVLRSDMQAFKAANPGAVLGDFVRWHSPRDWEDGQLSERMRIEGNLWEETWRSARPLAVSQQARLFNETKEAEKVFQLLQTVTLQGLIDLLLPLVATEAVELLAEQLAAADCAALVHDELKELCRRTVRCTKLNALDDYYDIRRLLESIECTLAKFTSLAALFDSKRQVDDAAPLDPALLHAFTWELVRSSGAIHDELALPTQTRIMDAPRGPLASLVERCVGPLHAPEGEYGVCTKVARKQYILRWLTNRPGLNSRLAPQRMYVSVEERDYRLCGAFSSDLTFL